MKKIPEECIPWFCLLACIINPDKSPEYYLSMFGIYTKKDVKKRQEVHYEWYLIHKEKKGKDIFD